MVAGAAHRPTVKQGVIGRQDVLNAFAAEMLLDRMVVSLIHRVVASAEQACSHCRHNSSGDARYTTSRIDSSVEVQRPADTSARDRYVPSARNVRSWHFDLITGSHVVGNGRQSTTGTLDRHGLCFHRRAQLGMARWRIQTKCQSETDSGIGMQKSSVLASRNNCKELYTVRQI